VIYKSQNESLLILSKLSDKNPKLDEYSKYCLLREQGLRKKAFDHLERFIKDIITWSLEERIEFVKLLFPYFEDVKDADYGGFPQPLNIKVVKPTLEEWCSLEKTNGNPFRWYGKYYRSEEHLNKALKLNPNDDLARITLILWWSDKIYYSLHHLPYSYIGNYEKDIELMGEIKKQVYLLNNKEMKESATRNMKINMEILTNYQNWIKTGDSDFTKWGKKNHKITGYGIKSYYYEYK